MLAHLDAPDLLRAGAACRLWRRLHASDALWRTICLRRWRLWHPAGLRQLAFANDGAPLAAPAERREAAPPALAGLQPDAMAALVDRQPRGLPPRRPAGAASHAPAAVGTLAWKEVWRRRLACEAEARRLLQELVWPLRRPRCLQRLVELGTLILEKVKEFSRKEGDMELGMRYFASMALDRLNVAGCVHDMTTLLALPAPQHAVMACSAISREGDVAEDDNQMAKCERLSKYPELDVVAAEAQLDTWAARLQERLDRDEEVAAQGGVETSRGSLLAVHHLNALLFGEAGREEPRRLEEAHGGHEQPAAAQEESCLRLRGNEDDYYNERNSYLNDVLTTRMGIPISLAVIHVAVGRSCGIPLHMIGLPRHFLTKVGAEGDPSERFIDVFNRGHLLHREECVELIQSMGLAYTPRLLEPVAPASRHPSAARTLPLLDLLLAIRPEDHTERFCRARDLLAVADYEAALADLRVLLQVMRLRQGGEGVEGLSQALLEQYVQRAEEMQAEYEAICRERKSPRPPVVQRHVGDMMCHLQYGYRGVIYGWDAECAAEEEWIMQMKVNLLPHSRKQPFYHVLVDGRDRFAQSTYGESDALKRRAHHALELELAFGRLLVGGNGATARSHLPWSAAVAQENVALAEDVSPVQHAELGLYFVGHRPALLPGPCGRAGSWGRPLPPVACAAFLRWPLERRSASLTTSDMDKWWSADTVAVVTGANKGIGYFIARRLATEGVTCIATARKTDLGEEAVSKLRGQGFQNIVFHQLDITDGASVDAFARWLEQTYGGLDVLVNNAGFAYKGNVFGAAEARQTLDVNYRGTRAVCERLKPLLRSSTVGARVVNVCSGAGKLRIVSPELQRKFSDPNLTTDKLDGLVEDFITGIEKGTYRQAGWPDSMYGVSKLAEAAYTRILARELKDMGVLVNACNPGWCRTDMAGSRAPRSADDGADTPVFVALAPPGSTTGGYFNDQQEEPF
eukprot:SM000133S26801  [mRNA]  locus=s133:183225:189279:- [translate_table: standard]